MTDTHFATYVIAVMFAWRLASLLVYERGLFGVFEHIRARAPSELREGLRCMYCTTVWTALLATVFFALPLITFLAISAGAIVVDRVVARWT